MRPKKSACWPPRFAGRLIVLAGLLVTGAADLRAEPLRFAVLGDTQDASEAGHAATAALIARLNGLAPAFTVHIGDIKGGRDACDDLVYARTLDLFARLDHPLVFTPGDNDWTDCHASASGPRDPLERLAHVRATFFPRGASLGARAMPLVRQSEDRAFATFVENARWHRAGVVFATLHIVGSNNNLRQDFAAAREHFARHAANMTWLAETFAFAEAREARAVVLFIHANPAFDTPPWQPTGFDGFRAALTERAADFARPVLLVHGDTHRFRIDQPLRGRGGRQVGDVTRLEVFGPPDLGAIVVEVDPDRPAPFRFLPLRQLRE